MRVNLITIDSHGSITIRPYHTVLDAQEAIYKSTDAEIEVLMDTPLYKVIRPKDTDAAWIIVNGSYADITVDTPDGELCADINPTFHNGIALLLTANTGTIGRVVSERADFASLERSIQTSV